MTCAPCEGEDENESRYPARWHHEQLTDLVTGTGGDDDAYGRLFDAAVTAVDDARRDVAIVVNARLVATYWAIGEALLSYEAGTEQTTGRPGRAQVRKRLAADLQRRFPGGQVGLSDRTLRYAEKLVGTWRQLDEAFGNQWLPKVHWKGHTILLDGCAHDPELLRWYAPRAVAEGWSGRELAQQIKARMHERAGSAPTNFDRVLPGVSREQAQEMLNHPVTLPLLLMPERERQLEARMLERIQEVMLSIGHGLTFKGSQVPLRYNDDKEPLYADLLFFSTELLCWVVVELKGGAFDPRNVGQLNTYIWLVEEQYRRSHHRQTIGVVLATEVDPELARHAMRGLQEPMAIVEYGFLDEPSAERRAEVEDALPRAEIEAAVSEAVVEIDGDHDA